MSQMGQFRFNEVILYISDNDGDRISPIANNINIVGDGVSVTTDSTAGNAKLTISLKEIVATQYDTDAGSAVPAGNKLNVSGGSNINTEGTGNTVTVNLDNTVSITGNFTTSTGNIEATAGSVTAGNGLTVSAGSITFTPLGRGIVQSSGTGVLSSSEGTDGQLPIASSTGAVSWNNLSSANASIGITNGSNSISLDITGTTDHAIQVGNSQGTISSLGVGATDTVLVGNTGADPSFTDTPTVTSLTATTVYGDTFDTNVAAAGTTLSGTTLQADGTDADIDINITPKGAGVLATTELTLTTDLAVEHGGTGQSSLTQYAVLLGNGTAGISEVADLGNAGEVLTSNGAGSAPTWQAGSSGSEFEDNVFRVIDETDNTKKLAFQVSDVTTGTTRTITAADRNINLDAVPDSFSTDSGSATPSSGSVTIEGGTNIATSGTGSTVTVAFDGTLAVDSGGTGQSSLTDGGILLGSGTSGITATAQPTDGQLLIGHSSADPELATLTAGTGIDVTNGSGAITLASTGTSINAQTGTSYTLVLSDAGKLITLTNSSAITLTVPPDSSVDFDVGTQILIYQGGAGTVTIDPGSGVTINSSSSELDTADEYAMCGLMKLDTDTWVFTGDKA